MYKYQESGQHLPGIQWPLTDAISLPFLLAPISSRLKMWEREGISGTRPQAAPVSLLCPNS